MQIFDAKSVEKTTINKPMTSDASEKGHRSRYVYNLNTTRPRRDYAGNCPDQVTAFKS